MTHSVLKPSYCAFTCKGLRLLGHGMAVRCETGCTVPLTAFQRNMQRCMPLPLCMDAQRGEWRCIMYCVDGLLRPD
jgi:hypothetical protein